MSTFVDTSAFIGLLVAEDENHDAAGGVWRKLVESDEQIMTSNYVVLETCALLQRRSGTSAIRTFVEQVLPLVIVEWVDPHLHDAGLNSVFMSGRRGPSMVDCVSFAIMRKLKLHDAFAFDPHFRDQGFGVSP